MSLNEFSLIEKYFAHFGQGESIVKGVGDDAAILDIPKGNQLVTSVDTLVSGVHFPQDAEAGQIARRALRVNLSDLAAMGAKPLGFTLALTIPGIKEDWLSAFSAALAEDALTFNCPLIGGDTTAGLLTITLSVFGTVPDGQALLRSGAQHGDHIYVTGHLGDAAAALSLLKASDIDEPKNQLRTGREYLLNRFYQPTPRLPAGEKLRSLASAALDVSDGLLADLGHITRQSGVGAQINVHRLPLSETLKEFKDQQQAIQWALTGGDDYELCFTVPAKKNAIVEAMISLGELNATEIGRIIEGNKIRCLGADGEMLVFDEAGYQHF